MKIDTHQHYWRYDPESFPWISDAMPCLKRDRLPEHCRPSMTATGVAGAIAVQARSGEEETDFLLDLAAHSPGIVGVVGWVDLRGDDLDRHLEAWSGEPLLKGFRHILQDEPDLRGVADDPAFRRGVGTLQERSYVYDVLVRGPGQLAAVQDFCAAHDRYWLVLDHLGKPDLTGSADAVAQWRTALSDLSSMTHVVCKISGLVTETRWSERQRLTPDDVADIFRCMDEALDAFGADRIVFGSDWPVCELAAPYATVFGLTQAWASSRLSPTEEAAFWLGNAARYYDLAIGPGAAPGTGHQ